LILFSAIGVTPAASSMRHLHGCIQSTFLVGNARTFPLLKTIQCHHVAESGGGSRGSKFDMGRPAGHGTLKGTDQVASAEQSRRRTTIFPHPLTGNPHHRTHGHAPRRRGAGAGLDSRPTRSAYRKHHEDQDTHRRVRRRPGRLACRRRLQPGDRRGRGQYLGVAQPRAGHGGAELRDYAQEQQITIRGFGARSQFGVRGIKLLPDGIPASTPDGQGGSGL